jgi:hypothetical protein
VKGLSLKPLLPCGVLESFEGFSHWPSEDLCKTMPILGARSEHLGCMRGPDVPLLCELTREHCLRIGSLCVKASLESEACPLLPSLLGVFLTLRSVKPARCHDACPEADPHHPKTPNIKINRNLIKNTTFIQVLTQLV